jgi:hypothetical protein
VEAGAGAGAGAGADVLEITISSIISFHPEGIDAVYPVKILLLTSPGFLPAFIASTIHPVVTSIEDIEPSLTPVLEFDISNLPTLSKLALSPPPLLTPE